MAIGAADVIGLAIYLLKKDQVREFEQTFPPTHSDAVPLVGELDGWFLPIPSTQRPPQWVTAVNLLIASPLGSLLSQNAAGLLVIKRAGRTFVATFGSAWQRLEDQWLERDFGRRVALNLLDKDGLLEIRAEQVFGNWHIASERAPRGTRVEEFGVEFDRDLVGAVEGVPKDPIKFGRTIRGATSLRIALRVSHIGSFLDGAEGLFLSDRYRKNWPDIDNLAPVKDPSLETKLEGQLERALQSRTDRKRIVMFTPSFRRDEALVVDSYVFGRLTTSSARTHYLTVESWVNALAREHQAPSVSAARSYKVHMLDADGDEAKVCSAFDCFGFEIGLGGRQYILASGMWYEADGQFLERVTREIASIDRPAVKLLPWNGTDDEAVYNKACCVDPTFLLFDRTKIWFGGGSSQFEFCDIFHAGSKSLIFAKHVLRSTGMSHLVEQVRRTTELLFAADSAYRAQLKKVFKKWHPSADSTWLDQRPTHGEWDLCLVSMGKSAKELPFFAKCSLLNLQRDLAARGHRVSFGKV